MESAAIIGIDLAKSVFQLHGADATVCLLSLFSSGLHKRT
ncbi:hypothetical protein Brsp05_03856 [Brucella sp. NBRC 12953]